MPTFDTEVQIQGTTTELETIEIRNPSNSGVSISIMRVGVVAEATFQEWIFQRYDGPATHGTPTPDAASVYERKVPLPDAACEVYYSSTAASFDWSNVTVTWRHTEQIDSSDAGDDAEVIFFKYFEEEHEVLIAPGESLSITVPAAELPYRVVITWAEKVIIPAEILDVTLPGGGVYEENGEDFDIPVEWRDSVRIGFEYTAANGSTNGRPKWRLIWADGIREYQQPIVETSFDLTGAVALRATYVLEEEWPTGVTANESTAHFVVFPIPPGMQTVRFEAAEVGDAAHPGHMTAEISGW